MQRATSSESINTGQRDTDYLGKGPYDPDYIYINGKYRQTTFPDGYLGTGTWNSIGYTNTQGASKTVNPNDIRFSQSSVNGAKEITESMKANGWVGDSIDVVKMSDGKLTTVDNTRVLAAKNAGIDVQANIHAASDPIPADVAIRFTSKNGTIPKTWGEAVTNRINNQNSTYRTTYPNGSNITGWDGK